MNTTPAAVSVIPFWCGKPNSGVYGIESASATPGVRGFFPGFS
jgi:hypothetical protein